MHKKHFLEFLPQPFLRISVSLVVLSFAHVRSHFFFCQCDFFSVAKPLDFLLFTSTVRPYKCLYKMVSSCYYWCCCDQSESHITSYYCLYSMRDHCGPVWSTLLRKLNAKDKQGHKKIHICGRQHSKWPQRMANYLQNCWKYNRAEQRRTTDWKKEHDRRQEKVHITLM